MSVSQCFTSVNYVLQVFDYVSQVFHNVLPVFHFVLAVSQCFTSILQCFTRVSQCFKSVSQCFTSNSQYFTSFFISVLWCFKMFLELLNNRRSPHLQLHDHQSLYLWLHDSQLPQRSVITAILIPCYTPPWLGSSPFGICLPGTELLQYPFRTEFSMGSLSWQYCRSLRHCRDRRPCSRRWRSFHDSLNIVKHY